MKKLPILILSVVSLVLCLSADVIASDTSTVTKITADNGSILISAGGTYTVSYRGKAATYNKVKTFLMFNNSPYFELDDGRIMKWTTLVSNESYNLQKIWDKLYFTKQYGDGGELTSVSLFTIDKTEKLHEIKITEQGHEAVFEEYGVIGDHYITDYTDRRNGNPGYCVVDKGGKIQKCYTW